jgi:hypothetical protein
MTFPQDEYKQVLGPRRLWPLRLLAVCVFSVLFITWALSTGGTSSPWITGGFVALSVAVTSKMIYLAYPRSLELGKAPDQLSRLLAVSIVSLILWTIFTIILTTFGAFLPLPTEVHVSLLFFWIQTDTNLIIFFISGTVSCLCADIFAFAPDDLSYAEDRQADNSASSALSS